MHRNTNSTYRGANGAWQKFERGEISLLSFYEAFGYELSDTVNGNKWYTEYCHRKGIGKTRILSMPSLTPSLIGR